MKKKRFLVPLVVVLLLIVFLWRGFYWHTHQSLFGRVGQSVPAFSSSSLFYAKKTIDEKIFQGQISVVNIFTAACVACHAEHSLLLQLKQNDPKVQIVGIAFKDHKKLVVDYLKKFGNPFNEVINDASGAVGARFDAHDIPVTFVIDHEGVIRDKIVGPLSAEILKNQLLPLLVKLQKAQPVKGLSHI